VTEQTGVSAPSINTCKLTLPGKIPGLLRRGSPVILHKRHYPVDWGTRGVCGHKVRRAVWGVLWDLSWGEYSPTQRNKIALDLTDATGRAHAAWWLASHFGDKVAESLSAWWMGRDTSTCPTAPMVFRVTRPSWLPDGFGLTCWDGQGRRPGWSPNDAMLEVPALATLDPRDDLRLPDGSRWVDAEALRLVCLHVAGLSG
jgi:hypothetical protein